MHTMKKLLTIILLLLFVASAAEAQELIYLRDGSVVEGTVTERQTDNDDNQINEVEVLMRDGRVAVYAMSDVECIIKDRGEVNESFVMPTGNERIKERHKGLDFNMDLNYSLAMADGDSDKFGVQLGLGKRFTRHFYWGVGTGIIMPMADLSTPIIPVTSDFRIYIPTGTKTVTPGCAVRVGYAFNTEPDVVVKAGQFKQTIKASDFILLQIMPTVAFSQSGKSDLVVGVGYTCYALSTVAIRRGMITVSVGFNLGRPMQYYRVGR